MACIKIVICGEVGVGKTCLILKLQLFELVSQLKYSIQNKIYIKRSNIIFLIYDSTNLYSFDKLKDWYNFTREYINNCL